MTSFGTQRVIGCVSPDEGVAGRVAPQGEGSLWETPEEQAAGDGNRAEHTASTPSLALATALVLAWGCARPPIDEVTPEPLPPVSAKAMVDKAVATTGDVITYTVMVEHDAKIEVQVPELGAEIAGFRIIDTGAEPAQTKKGRTTITRWYTLRADLVGSYILPAITLKYRPPRETTEAAGDDHAGAPTEGGDASVSTSEIFIEVKSVLPKDGEAKDIRDLKPLVAFKKPVWPYFALGGALLVLGLAVGGVVLYRRRRRHILVPPPPPHEIAYAALDLLRSTDFSNREAVQLYFYALSEILRTYIEGRFGLNATDLTTEELLGRLAELPPLTTEQHGRLKEFLATADLVKYASHAPKKEEIEGSYEQALTFIETTAERPDADPAGEAQP